MTIADRILERLDQINMSQKEFAEEIGISQSTISEWKSKKTNPSADKILLISKVLDVSPEWLLSATEYTGKRGKKSELYVVGKNTDMGNLLEAYNKMDSDQKDRLVKYAKFIMGAKNGKSD